MPQWRGRSAGRGRCPRTRWWCRRTRRGRRPRSTPAPRGRRRRTRRSGRGRSGGRGRCRRSRSVPLDARDHARAAPHRAAAWADVAAAAAVRAVGLRVDADALAAAVDARVAAGRAHSQEVRRAGHRAAPLEHTWPAGHTLPQAPQCSRSVAVLTQRLPLHRVCAPGQLCMQAPLTHTLPPGHGRAAGAAVLRAGARCRRTRRRTRSARRCTARRCRRPCRSRPPSCWCNPPRAPTRRRPRRAPAKTRISVSSSISLP
jgi:hypothetical protein